MAESNGNTNRRGDRGDPPIIDNDTGEILQPANDVALAASLERANIDVQIETAKKHRRDITKAKSQILSYATMDADVAAECMYALPRGDKPITGPSIRFAEMVMQAWGNCRTAARVVGVDRDEMVVIAEGVYHDLESNAAVSKSVRRSIRGRNGRIYSADMIAVTGNAACSIALRNAILAGVPKSAYQDAYTSAARVAVGDVKALAQTRDAAVKAFSAWGIKPEKVFAALKVGGMDDIMQQEILVLRGMFSAIKNGEATPEEYFSDAALAGGESGHAVVKDPLKNDAEGAPAGAKTTAAPAPGGAEVGKPAGEAETSGAGQSEREPDLADRAAAAPVGAGRAAESKAAEQPKPKTDEQRQPRSAAEPAKSAGPEINDDTIEQAEKEGWECADMGMSKRTLPDEYKRTLLEKAWVRGYDKRIKEDGNR